jgi:hypothetical protein
MASDNVCFGENSHLSKRRTKNNRKKNESEEQDEMMVTYRKA